MSLMEELRNQYKKARNEKDNKNNTLALEAYNKVIVQIKKDVSNAKEYSNFDFNIFYYDEEIKAILCERLKKDGFLIRFSDYDDYFEISGWGDMSSP